MMFHSYRSHRGSCRFDTPRRFGRRVPVSMPPAVRPAFLFIVLILTAAHAHAFTIRGNIVNGTTGATVNEAKVAVVNPAGGMMQERELEAKGGRFEASGLDDKEPIYLLRVDYDGETIDVTDGTFEYHVVPDRTRPIDFEVYEVTSVVGHGDDLRARNHEIAAVGDGANKRGLRSQLRTRAGREKEPETQERRYPT